MYKTKNFRLISNHFVSMMICYYTYYVIYREYCITKKMVVDAASDQQVADFL